MKIGKASLLPLSIEDKKFKDSLINADTDSKSSQNTISKSLESVIDKIKNNLYFAFALVASISYGTHNFFLSFG